MSAWEAVTVAYGPPSADVMPWGKHKGKTLDQVPKDYIQWALRDADHLTTELRRAMERQLGMKEGSTTGPPPAPRDDGEVRRLNKVIDDLVSQIKTLKSELIAVSHTTDLDRLRRIVKQWYRTMSLRYHPDHGGSLANQTIVNVCYEDLQRRLESCVAEQSRDGQSPKNKPPWS